jgi:preprotein translocase SecE subunit
VADSKKARRSSTVTKTRVVTTTDDTEALEKAPSKSAKTSPDKKTAKKSSAASKTTPAKDGKKPAKRTKKRRNPFVMFWGYLKGAWYELRQVRWPNRRETWGMTLAVILFSAFFVVLVLLLDWGYKYLFDLILER